MDRTTLTTEFAGYRCHYGASRLAHQQGLPTLREAETLAGLASGMTQKELAKARGVSPATIRSTAEAAYYRLKAQRATEAVAKAMRRGWIAPLAVALALAVSALAPQHQPAQRVRQPVRVVRQVRRVEEVIA